MKPHVFKAVILDLDGVITQTAEVHARAWKATFDELLERHSRETGTNQPPFDLVTDYREYVDGKPRYDGVRSFLRSRQIELPKGDPSDGPDRRTVCGVGNRKNELFKEIIERDGADVYEDAVAQIGHWEKDGLKLGVMSSSRNCRPILRAAKLLDRFETIVDGNDIARLGLRGKPEPDPFLQAAKQLGVEPWQAIVVEDAISGVASGRAGHFGLVVGVDRHNVADELRDAGADRVVRDLRELQVVMHCKPEEICLHSPRSAMAHLPQIANRIRGHKLAVFLDYDGTLTPIVRRPEEAVLSQPMRDLLCQLAEHCAVAIISGRDRQDVQRMVDVSELVYAGSHGFDVRGPSGLKMEHEEAQDFLDDLDGVERLLQKQLAKIQGARVERKRYAIAIHYREVDPENVDGVSSVVDEAHRQYPRLRKRGGKKIYELQPDVEWDKGHSLVWLAKTLGLFEDGNVILYIGDDDTDEDAFRELRYRGIGLGIRVDETSCKTHAQYFVRDCDEVFQFLQWLLSIVREEESAPQA